MLLGMEFWKHKKPSFTLLVVVLLPVLLGLMAMLQYHWLGEISRAERERLQARLQADTKRFSQEFNGEITKAFFAFQIESDKLALAEVFTERFDLWQKQTAFPNLIGEIYTAGLTIDGALAINRFNQQTKQFEGAQWTPELLAAREKIVAKMNRREPNIVFAFDSIVENIPALIVPSPPPPIPVGASVNEFELSARLHSSNSFVIVKLNSEAIKTEVFPNLIKRNFADDTAAYNFTVTNRSEPGKIVFQSNEKQLPTNVTGDAATGILDLAPDSANILILGSNAPQLRVKTGEAVIFHQKLEARRTAPESGDVKKLEETTQIENLPERSRSKIIERRGSTRIVGRPGNPGGERREMVTENNLESAGRWLLTVRHTDGSLENYVSKTRWHNLGLSFGILSLLGASVVLLIVTTHRAKIAAQRQIDFVSSVSHEFRTPVAVICSAGDNLADGIVQNQPQIEKYGKLIGREGRRLAEMVEQILEFAGARSKRRKYDFQPIAVESLIETVLADNQPLLEEKNFAVEREIAADLPPVLADSKALKHALQNLVSNSIKYSNGTPWLKISARAEKNGNGEKLLISVIDKGIGIEAKELKHIFEPFYRGKEVAAAQIHGNGLGLSIVKQTIEAHNGKIKVESSPGKGSQFTIELPAETVSQN